MDHSPLMEHKQRCASCVLFLVSNRKSVHWTTQKFLFIFIVTLTLQSCEPLSIILTFIDLQIKLFEKTNKNHWNLYYSIKNTFPNQNYFILILSIRYKSTSHCRNHVRSQQNISFLSLLMDFLLVLPKNGVQQI